MESMTYHFENTSRMELGRECCLCMVSIYTFLQLNYQSDIIFLLSA